MSNGGRPSKQNEQPPPRRGSAPQILNTNTGIDANQVSIVLISPAGGASENMLARLNELRAKNQSIKYKIKMIQEESIAINTALKINDENCDIVLVDENINSSAWKISQHCNELNPDNKKIFYLAGNAENILDNEFKQSNFYGSFRIDLNGSLISRSSVGIDSDPNKKYNIASIGKTITAVAIVQLEEKKILPLDKPIIDSLLLLKKQYTEGSPEFLRIEHYEKEFKEHFKFTPKELLNHTSGLNDQLGRIYEDGLGPQMMKFESAEDYVKHCAPLSEQTFETKGEHQYSNFGYFILGLAIEATTGVTYHKYVHDNILKPWGMDNTAPKKTDGITFATPHFKLMPPLPIPDYCLADSLLNSFESRMP